MSKEKKTMKKTMIAAAALAGVLAVPAAAAAAPAVPGPPAGSVATGQIAAEDHPGWCLGLAGDKPLPGQAVLVMPCRKNTMQLWILTRYQAWLVIAPARDIGLCLGAVTGTWKAVLLSCGEDRPVLSYLELAEGGRSNGAIVLEATGDLLSAQVPVDDPYYVTRFLPGNDRLVQDWTFPKFRLIS
jgi:hypothetical protein